MKDIKHSKLVEILKQLDKSEIERLRLFMNSRYFVSQRKVIEFANIIIDEYPYFQGDMLLVSNIYHRLYPNQQFQLTTIKDIMTVMVSYVHKFLVAEKIFSDDIEQGLLLMEELRKRELGKEFLRIASKLSFHLVKERKDKDFYYKIMRFEGELDNYNIVNKEFLDNSDSLQRKADALDIFFLSSKLSILCDMINRQNIFSYKLDISMMDFVLNYVEKNFDKFEDHSSVNTYHRILLTLINPSDEENYFKVVDLLDKTANDFSTQELKDIYTFAMNYCIKQINSGRADYEGHIFKVYCKLIETGLIYENNHISQWDYKNIVSASLRLAEFEWTENFILSNKDRINPVFKEVAYTYNLAYLYYEKKEFASALRTLHVFNDALKKVSDTDFDDTSYNLDSRTMFLKIYYESDEDDTLRATIETFKSYLVRNKKISDRRRKTYLNLLKYTKKLSNQRQRLGISPKSSTRFNVKKINNEINSDKNIINLSWLQARVEELENEIG